ncbi:TrbC/VirB2 family protein [Microbulbifer sp. 2201CG32-9]|uniref:TrbC/VirB2 family protein n=1 Tax=Microbulbifer sp. 2201CG32-9 TaxID=3232309 RepID=UPI00345B5F86
MMNFNSTTLLVLFAGLLAVSLFPNEVLASTSTGLPWESPLQLIQRSLTGPVALVGAILGIAAAGLSLVFAGGEMTEFIRRVVMLVLVISLIIGAASAITILFGTSSAVIGSPESLGLLPNGQ